MTKLENRILDFIRKKIFWIFIIFVSVMALILRFFGLDFKSGDYTSFLSPWWEQIKQGGLSSLEHQVGNYNIPYQIIIYLMTLLPWKSVIAYKYLSIIFDLVLAAASALLVRECCKSNIKLRFCITYAAVLCSLTVIFNSSFWAQCDSIYVSFIIFALYFLKKDKSTLSFIFLGLAFAFKLQVILILPFFGYYYFTNRKFSIWKFFLIPAVDVVLCLPAVFLGRNFMDIINVYITQTDYAHQIYMNFPNIYAFLVDGTNAEWYYLLKTFSIVLTFTILLGVLCLLIYKKTDLSDTHNMLLCAIWTVFTCLMFLSSMHERYSFLLDILLIIYVVIFAKRYWIAAVCNLISLRGYAKYMFSYEVLDIKWCAVIYIAVYLYVSYLFFREVVFSNADKIADDRITAEISSKSIAENETVTAQASADDVMI